MRLPKLAIENHQFTIVVVMLLVLSGLVSIVNMPRSEDPQVSPAGSSVIIVFPGANPADLEELVVDPIEEVLNELEDIKEIKTKAEDGLANIGIEFLSGSDPDDKYSEVVQKVNSIRSQLPEEIVRMDIVKWSISDVQILQLALISDSVSYRILEEEAERLKNEFERISGIKQVDLWAIPEQQVRVSIDLERIAAKGIALNQIMQIIQSNNSNIPGGHIDIGQRRFNIQTGGSFDDLEQLRHTIINAADGRIVYLKDVAVVEMGYEDQNYEARMNGHRAVFVTASQKNGTNIFDIFEGLDAAITAFQTELRPGIRVQKVFDQSQSVSHRVNGFFLNLLQGLILVGVVVFMAVGLRAATIVILAIPVSILIAIGFVDFSGYGLQQMSIAGLVIALGLLVDNAIVVTENISRFLKKGKDPATAAIEGTSQIAWPIVSSTITTVLAFVPMIMMRNITGDFIRSMPVTVVYTLLASLLVSLILTPYLSVLFLSSKRKAQQQGRVQKWLEGLIEGEYRRRLKFALGKPWLVLGIASLVFVLSISLFLLVGVSFFPKAEKPQLLINVQTPEGSSLDRTNNAVRFVEKILSEHEEVRTVAANVGHGNPRIYYNAVSRYEKSNYGQIFVELYHYDYEMFGTFISALRDSFALYPGARIEVKEFEQGPPVEAPIAIRLVGKKLDILQQLSAQVESIIRRTSGTVNVNNPLSTSKIDLHVRIHRDKAAMLRVPIVEINRTVRAAMAGLKVSAYRDASGNEYDIIVRLNYADELPEWSDFDRIYVSSLSGEQISLRQLATIEFESSPMLINHYNLERNVTVTADVRGTVSVDEATQAILKEIEQMQWPRGYAYYVGGELESREESFGGMMQAVIIAMIGIFGVLVLQFRSYVQPLIVFSAIPLAVIGSVSALLITGFSFSFTAFIGLTSLVGIVVNNSIILVDYTNQLRRDGSTIDQALQEAGETRFVPIILTTGTTVSGLLPLTLGGGTLWAPMGWTIIGGLILSTFLTLLVVPVLYKLITEKSERIR